MALTLQSATLVRDKVRGFTRGAGIQYALKSFWMHVASNLRNPDLAIIPIDGTATASDGGNTASQVLADAALTLYAIYLKKTGATATFFKATNHASVASTDGTEDFSYKLTTAGEENLFLFPNGHALATGLTITEDTTATGSTLNVIANKIDGFVIIGA